MTLRWPLARSLPACLPFSFLSVFLPLCKSDFPSLVGLPACLPAFSVHLPPSPSPSSILHAPARLDLFNQFQI